MKKFLQVSILLVVFTFSLMAVACQDVDKVELSLTAKDAATSVYVGETLQFEANPTAETEDTVVWSVSGLDDCGISQDGLLTAGKTAGKVTVKAELHEEGASATYEVDILAPVTGEVATAPVTIQLTYGDAISDSLITGGVVKYGEEELEGSFAFKSVAQQLNVGTHSLAVVFTPELSRYNAIETTVSVVVNKRPITVRAMDRNMAYGDSEAGLVYNVIDGSLVEGDEPTGALVREAGDSVGEYAITQGTLSFGDNYEVTFIPGKFTITKAVAEISFDGVDVVYNGQLQAPAITVLPAVDYTVTFNGEQVNGVMDAGVYEVIVTVNSENVEGTATQVFTINKLKLAISVSNIIQEYNPVGNAITLNVQPAVEDLTVTYVSANYESTIPPIEVGEYTVRITQPASNYVLLQDEFTFTIEPNGYFCEEVKLFAREEPSALIYDISAIEEEIAKLSIAGEELQEGEYVVQNGSLIIDSSVLVDSNGSNLSVNLYTATKLYVADIYVVDYMITESNWRNFLTNGGSNALTKNGLDKTYILMTDIEFGEEDYFMGIARSSLSASTTFKGVFDGNGHVIKNWTARALVNGVVDDVIVKANAGFVGVLSGVIKNLGFENLTIKVHGSATGHFFAGGIAGALAGGSIQDCYINGLTLHAYSANADSVATSDNSGVGTIFAATGTAPETAPSRVENVLVYGDITLVCRQAKNIRGIGTASATTGRYLVVNGVYISDQIESYLYGEEEALEERPLLIDSRAQVSTSNASYIAPESFKVGGDASIYEVFSADRWNFEEGSYPTLKVKYEMPVVEEVDPSDLSVVMLYAQGQEGYTEVAVELPEGVTAFDTIARLDGSVEIALTEDQYSIADGKIYLATAYLDTLAKGEHAFIFATENHSISLLVKNADVVITANNWTNYLTTGLTSANSGTTLATSDTTRLSKYYVLDTDIDYSTTTAYFLGIGRKSISSANIAFTGVFDGNGHTISNWIAGKDASSPSLTGHNAGFVSLLSGTVKNVGFINATVVIRGSSNATAGIIAGALVGGTIENCYINGATLSSTSTATSDNAQAGIIFGATGTGSSVVKNVLVFGSINVTTGATATANKLRGIGHAASTSGRLITVSDVIVTENITWKFFDGTNYTDSTYANNKLLIDSNANVTSVNSAFASESEMKVAQAEEGIYASFDANIWNFTEGAFPAFK